MELTPKRMWVRERELGQTNIGYDTETFYRPTPIPTSGIGLLVKEGETYGQPDGSLTWLMELEYS